MCTHTLGILKQTVSHISASLFNDVLSLKEIILTFHYRLPCIFMFLWKNCFLEQQQEQLSQHILLLPVSSISLVTMTPKIHQSQCLYPEALSRAFSPRNTSCPCNGQVLSVSPGSFCLLSENKILLRISALLQVPIFQNGH